MFVQTSEPPIRCLPTELLFQIFDWALVDALSDSRSAVQCPWTLAHVCMQWRQATLSFPSLWSKLRIHITESSSFIRLGRLTPVSPLGSIHFTAGLDYALRRSGSHPLSFRVEFSDWEDYSQELLIQLVSLSHRWEDIIIIAPAEIFNVLFDLLGSAQLPLLQSIHFQSPSRFYWDDMPAKDRCTAFQTAPKLRSASLNPILMLRLPSSHITELCISYPDPDDIPIILHQLPYLESFWLTGFKPWNIDHPVPTLHRTLRKVELPSLDHLAFFTLPFLTHLSISAISRTLNGPIIASFLSRSSCTISHLQISLTRTGRNVQDCLSLFRYVTNLEIGIVGYRYLFDNLRRNPSLLSDLESLKLLGDSMHPCNLKEVLALAEARSKTLRFIDIGTCSSVEPTEREERLETERRLVDAGLQVHLVVNEKHRRGTFFHTNYHCIVM
ncbi:uncharacterized protein BT62DRAFT_772616 [Guyanagaster necrorhizus]|uniref:F-box domain-containing protein n=1 Tax=Guyanagaster necrorhizus TaxID=856835 RepID=A0A9P7VF22_9AGAR|nr:uncharacterized protein BT62DRAFT_772616 [Guyanagaster necrorhizus MCA 3950]KAG7439215.1 hypothetical protein BT62DRAFT_772616 [Guyanagaster necrorhizus MCA 3950]